MPPTNEINKKVAQVNDLTRQLGEREGVELPELDELTAPVTPNPQEPSAQVAQPSPVPEAIPAVETMAQQPEPPVLEGEANVPNLPVVTPETQQLSTKDQMLQNILGQVGGGDLGKTESEIRDIERKREQAQKLTVEYQETQDDFDKQIEELSQNPGGKYRTRAGLNSQLNKLKQQKFEVLSDIKFNQELANEDYTAAEKIANERIAAKKAQNAQDIQLMQTAFDFIQNDLTDSEKLQAQAQIKEKSDLRSAQLDREQFDYEYKLTEPERTARLAQMAAQTSATYASAAASRASTANSYSAIEDRQKKFALSLQSMQIEENEELKATMTENDQKSEKALGLLESLKNLEGHPGLKYNVGPNPLYRTSFGLGFLTGEKADFRGDVEQFNKALTLGSMDLLKGPATDKDVEIVEQSVTRLGQFDITEKQYRAEMAKVREAAERIVKNVGINSEQADYYYGVPEEDSNEIGEIFGETATVNEFNPGGYY